MVRDDSRTQRWTLGLDDFPFGLLILGKSAIVVYGEPRSSESFDELVFFALLRSPPHASMDAVAEDTKWDNHGQQAADDDAGLQSVVLRFRCSHGNTTRW